MLNRPILAIDIGGGTQDVVLYDPAEPMENAVKLVLPSATVIAGRRIGRATAAGRPLFLSGRLMGGGAVVQAIRNHLLASLPVYSLADPALTINDNLDRVRAMGVRIVDEPPGEEALEVILGDLDLPSLREALTRFEVALPETIAAAVQDHGFSPNFSNRLNRFAQWRRFLDGGGEIGSLLFTRPPETLTRWRAVAATAPDVFLMDTCAAALRGALLDEFAASRADRGLTVVNVGNEHTVAFLVRKRIVWGVFEHHTSLLDKNLLDARIERFVRGELTHEEIFDQGGHGAAIREEYRNVVPFDEIIVTGPRREMARGLGIMAAPFGEMMLSGCFGLIEAMREHFD